MLIVADGSVTTTASPVVGLFSAAGGGVVPAAVGGVVPAAVAGAVVVPAARATVVVPGGGVCAA
eukprot:2216315-Rhodomonas_salina.1